MQDSKLLSEQEKTVKAIRLALQQGYKRILIHGASGSGKSFVANEISKELSNSNQSYFTFYISGNKMKSESLFYPFIEKILEIKNQDRTKNILKKSISELAKSITIGGDLASYLIETVSHFKDDRKKEVLRFFTSQEKQLFFDLDRLFNNKKVFFVVDDIQWLDDGSMKIIETLIGNLLNEWFSNFKNITFLFVKTDFIGDISTLKVDNMLANFHLREFNLNFVDEVQFLNTLKYFGFNGELDEKIANQLYTIIGGHLVLIKALAEYLISAPIIKNHNTDILFNSTSSIPNSIIDELLTFRLKALGASSKNIEELLKYASIIGLTFGLDELECLSDIKQDQFKDLLTKSEEAMLISGDQIERSFKHELIREFFFQRVQNNKYVYYYKFGECLRKLRPTDYYTRAQYIFDSGNIQESIPIYILAILKSHRDGVPPSDIVVNRILEFADDKELIQKFEKLILAYKNFEQGKYKEAIMTLDLIEDFGSVPIIAEKYYLLSLCYLKSMHSYELKMAIEYLKSWEELKEEEPEIWLRIMSTLMTIQTDVYNIEDAKKTERELASFLTKRAKFDYSSDISLNIIRRKAGALHISETACIRTKQSVDFFSETDATGTLLNPIQYYLSLINYSGSCITIGEYWKAFQYSKQGIDLIREYSKITFPETYICANNYIISGLLEKIFDAEQAIEMFNSLDNGKELTADKILIKNNYAVSLVYCNQFKKAKQVWEELLSVIDKNELDKFYTYFITTNYASLLFVLGNIKTAEKLWNSMDKNIPQIPDKVYFEKRHTLLKTEIMRKNKMDWKSWDNILQIKYPHTLGKGWSFYGKGFLFSDIQLWHES